VGAFLSFKPVHENIFISVAGNDTCGLLWAEQQNEKSHSQWSGF
jgi:hypothetical protein